MKTLLTENGLPIRFGFFIFDRWSTHVIGNSLAKQKKFENLLNLYISTKTFEECCCMSLSRTRLMCYDLDAHNDTMAKTLEERKTALLATLKKIGVTPALEKSGRGYHVWLVFNHVPNAQQRAQIHTYVEKIVPNIEGASFDEKYCIRLPGLYKNTKTYGIDADTNTYLVNCEFVKTFFEKRILF